MINISGGGGLETWIDRSMDHRLQVGLKCDLWTKNETTILIPYPTFIQNLAA